MILTIILVIGLTMLRVSCITTCLQWKTASSLSIISRALKVAASECAGKLQALQVEKLQLGANGCI
jgi:hypothetical protein